MIKRLFFLILTAALPLAVSAQTMAPPPAMLPEGVEPLVFPFVPLTMVTPAGEFPMLIEMALTPVHQQRGLMFRPDLPDDYGMLFVMPQQRVQAFWMRNTLAPLDIIYINTDNIVVSIAKGEPLNETALPSAAPARFVLELRDGMAETYGIVPGATLTFR